MAELLIIRFIRVAGNRAPRASPRRPRRTGWIASGGDSCSTTCTLTQAPNPTASSPNAHRRRLRSWIGPTLGALVSVALLWWLFKRVDVPAVGRALLDLSPWASLASALVICASIPLRSQQWRYLLAGAPEVTFALSARAICLGNLVNSVVPARGGEVAKAWLLSRWSGLPFGRILTSLVIARVLDLGCILILLGAMFAFVPIADGIANAVGTDIEPPFSLSEESLDAGLRSFAAVSLTAAVLLAVISLKRKAFGRLMRGLAARVSPAAARIWDRHWNPVEVALGVTRDVRRFWAAVGLNLACWVVFATTPLPMLLALGLDLRSALTATVGIAGLTTLAQLVPAAPTALGTFHATCLLALAICCPEIDAERALAFTLVFHVVDTLGASIPGLLLVPGAWSDLRSVRRSPQDAVE